MPLKFRPIGQPHRFGCLPTCVQAVRAYYGERLTYDEASEQCAELPGGRGCLWENTVTELGLSYEVAELPDVGDEENLQALEQKVEQEQTPVICHLGWGYDKSAKHAIVVVGINQKGVELMNPAIESKGRIDAMPKDEFLARWSEQNFGAFYFVE